MIQNSRAPIALDRRAIVGIGVAVVMSATGAWAAETGGGPTLAKLLADGGPLMYVLGALSIIGLALVIYLAISLRASAVVPAGLTEDLFRALDVGRVEEAHMICRRSRSAFAAIAEVAILCAERTPNAPMETIKEMVESEGARQAGHIQSRIQYLLDVAVVAPMVGLLGTVMGMLQAFNAVALDIAKARPIVLAQGVSQALITTAAGLIVGIPAMVAHAYFRGRGADLIARMESAAAELVLHLPARRGSR